MTASPPPVKVTMIREHLDGIPQFPFPLGYRLRRYGPGDATTWTGIWQQTETFQAVPPTLFANQFGTDEERLAQRLLFLISPGGEVIGTAAAWFNPDYRGQPYGRIHYVAILPSFQGRGLAKPLLTATCNRLVELDHARAYLATETVRRAAIHLYLQFGFQPEIKDEHDRLVWQDLRRQGLPVPPSG